MRIALVAPSLDGGGVARVTVNLSQGLRSRGHEVCMIVGRKGGQYWDEVDQCSQVVLLDGSCPVALRVIEMRNAVRQVNPDAVISGTPAGNIVTRLALEVLAVDTTHICVRHNVISQQLSNSCDVRRAVQLLAEEVLLSRCDHVVAVSEGVERDLIQRGAVRPDNVSTIYNPVVSDDLINQSSLDSSENHHDGAGPAKNVVVTVGGLVPQKDHRTLIQAWRYVTTKQPDGILKIIGDGPLRTELEEFAESIGVNQDVEFLGHKENPYPYMGAADLFVLSSRWEGFGLVLAEALVLGTKVVATDCQSGPREILEHGKYGRLVPVAQPSRLADAILETLEANITVETEHFLKRYDCRRVADEYTELVKRLTRPPHGPIEQ